MRSALSSPARAILLVVVGCIAALALLEGWRKMRSGLPAATICRVALPPTAAEQLGISGHVSWADRWMTRNLVFLDGLEGPIVAVGPSIHGRKVVLRQRGFALRIRCTGRGRVLSVDLASAGSTTRVRAVGRLRMRST